MLRSVKEIKGYLLQAQDGEIGRCKDFLFDDERWTVRYMMADTGKWLPGREVVISPIPLGKPDWAAKVFPVELTKQQIEDCPALDTNAPVSRQYEIQHFKHYGWPYYWMGNGLWGIGKYPSIPMPGVQPEQETENDIEPEKSHLRSVDEVTGYHIQAEDGDIGHVEDFIVDDAIWIIRYLVVDTKNWLPGRSVLVSPEWIETISWEDKKVCVDLTKEAIQDSPAYDPSAPVNREYEIRIYDYYGRPKYWP